MNSARALHCSVDNTRSTRLICHAGAPRTRNAHIKGNSGLKWTEDHLICLPAANVIGEMEQDEVGPSPARWLKIGTDRHGGFVPSEDVSVLEATRSSKR